MKSTALDSAPTTGCGSMVTASACTTHTAKAVGEGRSQGVDVLTAHVATPETGSSTHYWFWATRTFAISAAENLRIRGFVEYAFAQQDKPMLEGQQRNMEHVDFWAMKPVLLPSDAAAVRVRRKLAKLMENQ